MVRKRWVFLVLLLLFLLSFQIRDGATVEKNRLVWLQDKPVLLTVVSERDTSAEEVLDFACEALPALERVTGVPYPSDYAPRIVLGGDPAGSSFYAGRGTIGLLMTRHWRGALTHELAHLWFDYQRLPQWVAEGASDFFAYRAFLDLERFGEALDFRSRSSSPFGAGCPPLEHFTRGGRKEESYACAFVFFMRLDEVVGDEAMGKTNAIVLLRERMEKLESWEYERILVDTAPWHANAISILFDEFVYTRLTRAPGIDVLGTLLFVVTLAADRHLSARHREKGA